MKITTYEEYTKEKIAFIQKHDNDFRIYTSPFEGGSWHKEYLFEDGAVWSEVNTYVIEEVNFMHRGFEFSRDVELLRIEYYSTEEGSKYYFEKVR